MKYSAFFLLIACFLLVAPGTGISAEEKIFNGGFEEGYSGWSLFVPEQAKSFSPSLTLNDREPHSGQHCLKLHASGIARYGASARGFKVVAGEHYRIALWVRADSETEIKDNTPGFAFRLTLRAGAGDATGGHFYIRPDGHSGRGKHAGSSPMPLPVQWIKLEAVFEIPDGVDCVVPTLLVSEASGNIYIDDVSIVRE